MCRSAAPQRPAAGARGSRAPRHLVLGALQVLADGPAAAGTLRAQHRRGIRRPEESGDPNADIGYSANPQMLPLGPADGPAVAGLPPGSGNEEDIPEFMQRKSE
eukprot:15445576-Alexandrium_andersonii.AAC.2